MARPRSGRQPRAAVVVPRRVWKLEDAKARFSEVVKLALSEGPQRITRRGRPAVVITADADSDRPDWEDVPGAWVKKLRGPLSRDIDLMALIGPPDRRDRSSRSDPVARLLRDRRK
jgi:prevent-host-death family protein